MTRQFTVQVVAVSGTRFGHGRFLDCFTRSSFDAVSGRYGGGVVAGVPAIVTASPPATDPEKVARAPVAVVAKVTCSAAFAPADVFALALHVIDVPDG